MPACPSSSHGLVVEKHHGDYGPDQPERENEGQDPENENQQHDPRGVSPPSGVDDAPAQQPPCTSVPECTNKRKTQGRPRFAQWTSRWGSFLDFDRYLMWVLHGDHIPIGLLQARRCIWTSVKGQRSVRHDRQPASARAACRKHSSAWNLRTSGRAHRTLPQSSGISQIRLPHSVRRAEVCLDRPIVAPEPRCTPAS